MVGVDPQQWWTPVGLDHAEYVALEVFPTPESWLLPQNMFVADRFHRYIGEVFRRTYGGRWVNLPRYDDADAVLGYCPVVDRPYDDEYFDPTALLNIALTLRTGTELSDRFGDEADYAQWCRAGKPDLPGWFDEKEDAMGDRPYTKAELRQQVTDQEDPRWLAWLEGMNKQIDRFLNETVPDMPEDPWTAEGLRHAETTALKIFPNREVVLVPENRDVADQFSRYVGETFRRNFEGEWRNEPSFDDRRSPLGFGPVVRTPENPEYLDVVHLLTATVHHRTGDHWSRIFGYSTEGFAKWKASQVG
ncbi:hypothetical protein [Nocardia colli]|uniref:hypothetical protein n=1 Tax=Nocardia colli TaxID=2545717 RepID=UPI0035D77B3E